MNTCTIYDNHTVSNTCVYCLLNKANTTTVFQTKLFPVSSSYCQHIGKLSLQKSLNDPITQSKVIRRTWWPVGSDNSSSGKHRKVRLPNDLSHCLIIHRSHVLESSLSFCIWMCHEIEIQFPKRLNNGLLNDAIQKSVQWTLAEI